MLTVNTARRVSDIFWPAFVERDGMIFLPTTPDKMWTLPIGRTRTDHERLQAHTHIQDIFRWNVPMRYDAQLEQERPDPNTPEHAAAWELAQQIGEMWLAKLTRDFPRYRFRVYVSRLDDPIVHFHRVRDGEPVWIADAEADATLIMHDSGRSASYPRQANER